jgi:hypothetical protein
MADGQLAMNTNLASPGLFFKDSNGDLVKTGPVHVGTTAPNATPASGGQAGNSKGELWLDTTGTDYTLKTWDGSAWREIVVTSTMIKDGTIVNADVNASAAIAGTKIAPDFGSQTIATTGVFSHALGAAATPSVTFTGDLNTGIFSPGADQVAISTNGAGRLFVDASGNVGLGTSSPGEKLDVSSGTSGTAAVVKIQDPAGRVVQIASPSSSTEAYIGTTTNHRLDFYTNNTVKATLDATGRLGIGTTTPLAKQTLTNGQLLCETSGQYSSGKFNSQNSLWSANTTLPSLLLNGGAAERPEISFYRGGNLHPEFSIREHATANTGGQLYAGSGSGAPSLCAELTASYTAIYTGSTERARIDSSGTLTVKGQGTAGVNAAVSFNGSAPVNSLIVDSSGRCLVGTSSALDNFSKLQITDTTGLGITLAHFTNTNSAGSLQLYKSRSGTVGTNTIVQNGDQLGRIDFRGADGSGYITGALISGQVDGTPGANDMPGRLVFSTTADGASTPTERMRIASNGVTGFFASAEPGFAIRNSAAAGTDRFLSCRYGATANSGGTESMVVRTNGDILNTNNSYGALSDVKLKENIVDATSQWDDLKALQVRKYNFKEGQTHTQIGLIAQEVELVSPGLVSESPDRDAEGNDLGTVTKSVNYSVLYMKAVKALQEAMERIETLEAKVAALEAA